MAYASKMQLPPFATSNKEEARFMGTFKIFPSGGTTNHDLRVNENIRLQGGWFWTRGSDVGDTVTFQVVDVDNITGAGANTVIKEYISEIPLAPWDHTQEVIGPTVAEIPEGLYLRVKCTTSFNAVTMGITYRWFVDKQ